MARYSISGKQQAQERYNMRLKLKTLERGWVKLTTSLLICVAHFGYSQFTTEPTTLKPLQELRLELQSHGIIPDCLNATPPFGLKIKFLEKVEADYGTILKPEMVKFAPYLIKYPVKNDTYYTVMMLGLDEPCRKSPSLREWLHYLVVNVPGPTVFQGEILARWVQPSPVMDSGYHRYVFLIYEQKARTAFSERRLGDVRSDKDRAHFSHQRFADKYGMGVPLAVNFFQCNGPFNASVPTVSSAEISVPEDNFYDMAEEEKEKEEEEGKMKEEKGTTHRQQETPEPFSLAPPER